MKFIRKHRKSIAFILCLLVTLLSLGVVSFLRFRFCSEQARIRLNNLLNNAVSLYTEYQEDLASLSDYELSVNHTYAKLFGALLEKEEPTVEILDNFRQSLPEYSFCFVKQDGTIISDTESFPSDELYTLLHEQPMLTSLTYARVTYSCSKTKKGWLLIGREFVPEILMFKHLDSPVPSENVMCWNPETKALITASPNAQMNITYDEIFNSEHTLHIESSRNPGLYIGYNENLGLFIYETKLLDDHTLLFAYADFGVVTNDTLRGLCVVLVLIPLVVITMCLYAIHIYDNDDISSAISKRKLIGHLSLRLEYFYHLSALLVVSIFIVTGTTAYIHLLTSFCEQNVKAQSTLDSLETRVDENAAIRSDVLDYMNASISGVTKQLVFTLGQNPDLMNQKFLSEITESGNLLGISEINVFDATGTIVASNLNNVGYSLSLDTTSNDYKILEFLQAKEDHTSIALEFSAYQEWELYRRQDAPGVIRITYTSPDHLMLLYNCTFAHVMDTSDFGEADKYFFDKNTPDRLMGRSDYSEFGLLENDWPELAEMTTPYTGVRSINAKFYYINSLIRKEGIIIRALPIKYIVISFLQAILVEFVTYIIIYGILILFIACHASKDDDEEEAHHIRMHGIPEKLKDGTFKRSVNIMITVSLILLVAIFAVDGLISQNALTRYLLSNKWDSGLNLFSFTKIIMMLLIILIVNSILQKTILLVSRGTSNRGITIGHLLCSMVKFGALIIFIVYALVQFGVKLSSLLAGAGFAGAALAFAGQSVVNDLLSGFFIVFEGKFGVGDWVTVGDFRGQIQEIGVRTTSIALGEDVKVFHNSALSGITVWSHGMGGAICYVDIAYREDVERVIKILQDNSSRYMDEIPQMEEPPYIHGVVELGSSGVTLRMTSYLVNQANAGRVQREMLRLTKRIFEENDVCIPFPQIVVHEGDADIVPIQTTLIETDKETPQQAINRTR